MKETGKTFADWMINQALDGAPVFPDGWDFRHPQPKPDRCCQHPRVHRGPSPPPPLPFLTDPLAIPGAWNLLPSPKPETPSTDLFSVTLWALAISVALALAVLSWEWLLHAVIVRSLRLRLARTGARIVLAFSAGGPGLLSRFGPETSGHARLTQASAEQRIFRLLDPYRQSVPAWCRQSLHP